MFAFHIISLLYLQFLEFKFIILNIKTKCTLHMENKYGERTDIGLKEKKYPQIFIIFCWLLKKLQCLISLKYIYIFIFVCKQRRTQNFNVTIKRKIDLLIRINVIREQTNKCNNNKYVIWKNWNNNKRKCLFVLKWWPSFWLANRATRLFAKCTVKSNLEARSEQVHICVKPLGLYWWRVLSANWI